MGAKESRQFPLTYDEAIKRGNFKIEKFNSNDLWSDKKSWNESEWAFYVTDFCIDFIFQWPKQRGDEYKMPFGVYLHPRATSIDISSCEKYSVTAFQSQWLKEFLCYAVVDQRLVRVQTEVLRARAFQSRLSPAGSRFEIHSHCLCCLQEGQMKKKQNVRHFHLKCWLTNSGFPNSHLVFQSISH